MNLMSATAQGGQAKIGEYLVPVDEAAAKRADGDIVVGVRPEAWRVVGPDDGGLPVEVTVVEELGADAFVYGTSGVEGTPNSIIVRVSARDAVHKGDVIHVTTDPRSVHVFDAELRRPDQRLGAYAVRVDRVGCWPARSAVRRTRSVMVPNSSAGMSWPMPSITRSSAPGMARAVARPPETCTILSAVPCTTAVGIRSEARARDRFGWFRIASIWRITPLAETPRSKVSSARSRTFASLWG